MDSPRFSGSPPLSLPSSPSSPSSPLLITLAATGPVLPHEDVAPNLLADQASHLTLSAPSAAVASAASAGGDSYPHSARTRTRARCSTSPAPSDARRRACSACSERTASESDAHGSGHNTPKRASALPATSASPISNSNMPDPSALPGAFARPNGALYAWPYEPSAAATPTTATISHEPAREARDVRCDDVATGEARHRLQLAGSGDVERNAPGPAASLAAFPAPWLQGFGCADPAWVASARAESNAFPVAMTLADLPNEVLLHVLGYLDVCDLLAMSRVSSRSVMPCPPALSAVLPRLPF